MTDEWTFNGITFTSEMIEDNIGFVYLIRNKVNDRLYVGKKLFHSTRTKIVKGKNGKPKRQKSVLESDWKVYHGSSAELEKDIQSGHQVERSILHLAKSRSTTSYLEMREQILREVLLDKRYYNGFIGGKLHRNHLKDIWK